MNDNSSSKKVVHLQIGMRVKIKKCETNYLFDSGKVKTITNELPKFGTHRAFSLDGDGGIWCIEDFEYCVDYPDFKME